MCSRKTNWNKQVLEYVVYIPGMFMPLFTEYELSGRLQVFRLHNRDLHPVEIMARFQPLSLVLNVDHCTFSILYCHVIDFIFAARLTLWQVNTANEFAWNVSRYVLGNIERNQNSKRSLFAKIMRTTTIL